MTHFDTIAPNIYRFRDLVNVYVLVREGYGLAIELGRGQMLQHLSEIGVQQLEWVLHTHHHRDLCQGDNQAVERGTKIAVPDHEADLFENAEATWEAWHIYVNYDLRSRRNAPRQNVPTAARLTSDQPFVWRGLSIQILDTPGHTDGAVSFLVDIDGQRFCFCGETITAPGKIPTIHDLHWGYMPPGSGLSSLIDALENIRTHKPDVLLPTRGEPMADPETAITPLREKLKHAINHLKPNHAGRKNRNLHQVADRIWFLGCTSFCILPENGHAFVWDYGYVPGEVFQTLRRDHGLKCIDAVAISHYHDDHVARIPELVHTIGRNQSPRPEVWVFENQADIYTDPTRFNIPCLWPTPIPYNRILSNDEVVYWEGVRLQFFSMPGQTEWHASMVADITGKRYAFTGDNLWKPADPRSPNGPIIWRNQQFLDGGTLKGFRKLRDLSPNVILPAHTDPIDPVTPEYLDAIITWSEQLRPMMEDLLDQPHPEFGCDCFWVRFDPYRRIFQPGEQTFQTHIIVRNHHDHPAPVLIAPALPDGWTASPKTVEKQIPAHSETTLAFNIHTPDLIAGRRHILAADIALNGVDHGEMAEMIIDVDP